MKRQNCLLISFVLLILLTQNLYAARGMQKVEYFSDSIAEKEGKYIRLLSGSSWVFSSPSLALVTDDVMIVFQEVELKNKKRVKIAVAYIAGDEILVKHVDGRYVTGTGYLTTVIEALSDGAVLKLADGSLLSVPEYDQVLYRMVAASVQGASHRKQDVLVESQEGKTSLGQSDGLTTGQGAAPDRYYTALHSGR